MNFRIAISSFPHVGDPARARILAALSEATGLSPELLGSRLDASPAWLFEVPDREEAEAWRALLGRQRGVVVATLPSLGRPVPSHAEALPRARVALGGGRPAQPERGASAGRVSPGRGIERRADEQWSSEHRGSEHRGSEHRASEHRAAEPSRPGDPPPPGRPTPQPSASASGGRRGITAPVSFLGAGGPAPDTEPQVQSIGEMLEPDAAPRPSRAPLPDGGLQLEQRRQSRGPAPTVAPAGLRRQAIDVRVSTGQRVLGPLVRVLVMGLLLGGAVLGWRHFNRPVVNKPAVAAIELLEEGRAPLQTLRYAPTEEDERFRVALSIEHRVATRQVEARPVIDTIGGEARLERLDRGDDYFDYKPSGRETRRGRVTLEPVRVLDLGHTGPLPRPWLPDVTDDDMPAMQAFARLLRPPFVKLPVEPVGAGARWRYRQEADQSPLGLALDVEAELLGRDAERLELGLKFSVPPTRDPGEAASAYQRVGPFFVRYDPPLRIFDFAGVGEGRATLNLGRMTPVDLDVAVQFAARMEVETEFGQQLIDYSPVVNLKIGED